MHLRLKCKIFLILLLSSVATVSAATTDSLFSHPLVHSLSFTVGIDYVASSVEDEVRGSVPKDEKIYVHSAIPLNFKYSFSFTNPRIRNYLPGGYQGVALGILNFGASEAGGLKKSTKYIGYPVLAYVFQGGPICRIKNNLSLDYEWNFGASFGWKPASDFNRYFNLTVGSRVNAYLNLNIGFRWQLNSHTALFAGAAVSHFSNGNTSFPNPGVNSLGLRVGAVYTLNTPVNGFEKAQPDTVKKRKIEYDIMGWGAARKRVYKGGDTPVLLRGRYACAGISFAPMYRINTWWRVGGSADFQWDESSDLKKNYVSGITTDDIQFHRPSFWRQVSVGLSAHAELQMPIFAVNIGCGYNFVAPLENRGTYQNIALKTYFTSNVFLNIGYQLRNFHQQSSLMLGLGVTI